LTRAETIAVITLAGDVASRRLPPEHRGTCHATAIHEAAHCIVALRLGVVPVRAVLHADGGATEFATDTSQGPRLSDYERARAVALITTPEASARDRRLWLARMQCRAVGLVNKHWQRILALGALLHRRGELRREEILALGPATPIPASVGTIARCD
jgi:hypothetical protein